MRQTVLIPQVNADKFEDKMKKLVKVSKKLASGNVGFRFMGNQMKEEGGKFTPYSEYIIEGEQPMLNGYRVVAKLEKVGDWNTVQHLDREVDIPAGLDKRENYCEHCNHNRMRKHLYILQDATGEFIQVGKTCVKDFTGAHNSPEAIADWYSLLEEAIEVQNWTISGGVFIDYHFNCLEVIATAIYYTEEFGYVKADEGNQHNPPTAQRVREALITKDVKRIAEERGYFKKAQEVMDWVMNREVQEYGYFKDLQNFVKEGVIGKRGIGIVGSAYVVYLRELEKEIQKKREQEASGRSESEFVGSIGDKKEYELIFDRETGFPTDFGWVNMYFFFDKNDNIYLWKTSIGLDLEEGQEVRVRGTLKDHSEYRGIKQNVLTRCKILG